MIKIDLNPKKKERKFQLKKISIPIKLPKISELGLIFIPIIILFLEFLYLIYLNQRISFLNDKKNELQTEIAKLKKYEEKLKEMEKMISFLEQQNEKLIIKIKTFEYISQYKKPLSPKIDILTKSLPDGLWLESLEISYNEAKVNGYSLKPEFISDYFKNLNTYYKDVSFNGTEKKVSQTGILYYNFAFNLKGVNLK